MDWEMTQLVMYLLCKHEDLGLGPLSPQYSL